MAKFKRVLLKLSGEALAGESGHGIDNTILSDMASEIASMVRAGIQVALVQGSCHFLHRQYHYAYRQHLHR